jgi:hypothetical protein
MAESAAFARLWQRVDREMQRVCDACEQAESVADLRRAQGAARALRMVLGLPAAMLAEMRKKR